MNLLFSSYLMLKLKALGERQKTPKILPSHWWATGKSKKRWGSRLLRGAEGAYSRLPALLLTLRPQTAARVSPSERAKQPLAFGRNSGRRGKPSSRLAPGARPGRAGSPGSPSTGLGRAGGTPALLPVCAPSLGVGASSSSAASPLLLLLLLLPTHPHALPRPSFPALRSGVLLQPVQLLREEVFQLF